MVVEHIIVDCYRQATLRVAGNRIWPLRRACMQLTVEQVVKLKQKRKETPYFLFFSSSVLQIHNGDQAALNDSAESPQHEFVYNMSYIARMLYNMLQPGRPLGQQWSALPDKWSLVMKFYVAKEWRLLAYLQTFYKSLTHSLRTVYVILFFNRSS